MSRKNLNRTAMFIIVFGALPACGPEMAGQDQVNEAQAPIERTSSVSSATIEPNAAEVTYSSPIDSLTWAQRTKWLASDGQAGDSFGTALSISGDTAIVGARLDQDNGTNAGAAYVFVRNGTTWTQQAKLIASNIGAQAGEFGTSVWVSGDTAIVGAPNTNWGAYSKGAAYVFKRNNGVWTETQILKPNPAVATFQFGQAVALEGDTALVGAPHFYAMSQLRGKLYVFTQSGGVWTEQQLITPSDVNTYGYFGWSIAMTADTAVVGAPSDLSSGKGSAYVYVRNGTTWTAQQKLVANTGTEGRQLGCSVALSGDTVLAGAYFDNTKGSSAGAAFVFVRSGTTWSQQAKLFAGDAAANNWFGQSVSLTGNTALIGATGSSTTQIPGSAYVFARNGTVWTEQQKLIANDGAARDWFGSAVAHSGNSMLVGAMYDDDKGNDSGSVYEFGFDGSIANGDTCTANSECMSGVCADGVCCDTVCDGVCMACSGAKKGSGADGVCGSIAYDTDPDEECWGGACDGKNVCKEYNGVSCTFAAQCLSKYCVDGYCCGNICMGECQACSAAKKGYGDDGVCENISANTNPDNECTPGECNGSGACDQPQSKSANGAACLSAAQCLSDYCADGVCCDSWCLGTCQACTAAKKGQGDDGVCGNIQAASDPDEECWEGVCGGTGNCERNNGVLCSSTAQCLSGHCVDGLCCDDACTGACYACSSTKKGQGFDGVCEPIANTKDPENECSPGECNGAGACNQSQTPQSNGASCVTGVQCASGFCSDGYCCDTACSGTCQACSATKKGTGTNGTCGNIAYDNDPDDECYGGACSGAGSCQYYNGVTCTTTAECLSNYCVDGFCCGNICTSTCYACSAAKKGSGYNGVCEPIANATDPDNECSVGECNGSGACGESP